MNISYLNSPYNDRLNTLQELGDYGKAEFTVKKMNLTAGHDIPVYNKKALVRTDTLEVLDVKGNNYNEVQHPDMFKRAEDIIAKSDLDLTGMTRKIDVSHNGARAYARYIFPAISQEVTPEDESQLELTCINSFDGSFPFMMSFGAVRLLCNNGQVFLNSLATYRSKHTNSLNVKTAGNYLINAINLFQKENAKWQEWREMPVSDEKALQLFYQVTDNKMKSSDRVEETFQRPKSVQLLLNIHSRYTKNSNPSVWTVYNALTDWSSHGHTTREVKSLDALRTKRESIIRSKFVPENLLKVA
jgi:hypothetical protein